MIETICQNCGKTFSKFPSAHAYAAARGTTVKFCSRRCAGEGRTKGIAPGKPRKGETLKCEVCESSFYRRQSDIRQGRSRFCSEPCRQMAFKSGLIDRTGPRPERKLGAEIKCCICDKAVYRKKSMIDRNIKQTCGARTCVSAYSRSLWNLPPRDDALVALPRHQRKRRATNFTAAQRAQWLGSSCVRCGTDKNLTLDHIIPVCVGGQSTQENAQTLCGPCNNWKASNVDRILARQQSRSGG